MSIASAFAEKTLRLAVETGERVRADALLYLFIATYTLAGLMFLQAVGASDRAAYSIYFEQWLVVFGMLMPTVAFLLHSGAIVHRFNTRRLLVFRKVFAPSRMAHFLSGICLLAAIMIFEGTFTSVKNALVVWQGGFPFDRTLADIDASLHFGTDPWRWLYAVAEYDVVRTIVEFNYNVFWFLICFSTLFFVATSPKAAAIRTRYILCFMLVWIVVGNVLAGLFMSAGPAFYGFVTGDAARFGDQLAFLARSDSTNSAYAFQKYLWTLHVEGRTGFGSGVSAFPSVHVGLITLNAMFAYEYNKRLGVLAFVYVAFVAASSVFLGWHYAIDGYVSAAISVTLCTLARKWLPDGATYQPASIAAQPVAGGVQAAVTAS